jgi:hypothetical protein
MKTGFFYFFLVALIILTNSIPLPAQNTRIRDWNTIGWYNYFGTFKTGKKTSIHTEYQWRRDELISQWQQSLLRIGFNYQATPKLQLRVGYGWIETFPYGDIPLNAMGKDFTEHRLFQVATITDKIGKTDFSHRFMLEQRWLGRYSKPDLTREDEYVFLNRIRYMLRLQRDLKAPVPNKPQPYAAVYNELFVGFGKNVNENVFDQNRLGVLVGCRLNNNIRLEAGYLNQVLQLAREVSGQNVFQHNNGIIVNLLFNLDWSRK